MKMLIFDDGQECWLHIGTGCLVRGTVLMRVSLPGYLHEHYIVEVQTEVEPVLEVRDGWTLSDSRDEPIGLWRKDNDQQQLRQDQERGWWRRLFGD